MIPGNDWRKTIPSLTREQVLSVDREVVGELGIELVQMMENAGRHLAELTRQRFLGGDASDKVVSVLAGTGGNGGGALVAARRLFGWGADVEVVLMRARDDYDGVPARQLRIVENLELSVKDPSAPPREGPDVIVDGMVGYGLIGRPKGAVADGIRWANGQPAPVIALDVPSGMDATTGETASPVIKAAATLTLALPKQGLAVPGAEELTGQLFLADIGVPPMLYRRLGVEVGPIFRRADLVRLS